MIPRKKSEGRPVSIYRGPGFIRDGWRSMCDIAAMPLSPTEMFKALDKLAKREKSDIYLFSAPIQAPNGDRFRALTCSKNPKQENVLLFLTPQSSEPDAPY